MQIIEVWLNIFSSSLQHLLQEDKINNNEALDFLRIDIIVGNHSFRKKIVTCSISCPLTIVLDFSFCTGTLMIFITLVLLVMRFRAAWLLVLSKCTFHNNFRVYLE